MIKLIMINNLHTFREQKSEHLIKGGSMWNVEYPPKKTNR